MSANNSRNFSLSHTVQSFVQKTLWSMGFQRKPHQGEKQAKCSSSGSPDEVIGRNEISRSLPVNDHNPMRTPTSIRSQAQRICKQGYSGAFTAESSKYVTDYEDLGRQFKRFQELNRRESLEEEEIALYKSHCDNKTYNEAPIESSRKAPESCDLYHHSLERIAYQPTSGSIPVSTRISIRDIVHNIDRMAIILRCPIETQHWEQDSDDEEEQCDTLDYVSQERRQFLETLNDTTYCIQYMDNQEEQWIDLSKSQYEIVCRAQADQVDTHTDSDNPAQEVEQSQGDDLFSDNDRTIRRSQRHRTQDELVEVDTTDIMADFPVHQSDLHTSTIEVTTEEQDTPHSSITTVVPITHGNTTARAMNPYTNTYKNAQKRLRQKARKKFRLQQFKRYMTQTREKHLSTQQQSLLAETIAHMDDSFQNKNRPLDHILKRPKIAVAECIQRLKDQMEHTLEPELELNRPRSMETNDHWGDMIDAKKDKHHRIYFQNVNNLKITKYNMCKWIEVLKTMKDFECDIFGFAEPCIDANKHRLNRVINMNLRKMFGQSHLSNADNYYSIEGLYKPGGALHVTVNSWVGRIIRHLNDPHEMGRWTGAQYRLASDRTLTVITGYRTCHQSNTEGVFSSHQQQLLKLRERFPTDPSKTPRGMFIIDLIHYVQQLHISASDYLIIQLDANEIYGEDQTGINTLAERLGVVDVLLRHHQLDCNVPTHLRSKKRRIDYIFGSESLMDHVAYCGYLPFHCGIDSDHRGIFLDLKPSIVDGQYRVQDPPKRLIGVNTTRAEVFAYKTAVLAQFHQHNIFERAETLYTTARENRDNMYFTMQLDAIDDEITQIVLRAEREKCTKRPSFWWSSAIHQASLLIKYWTTRQLQYRHNLDLQHQTQYIFQHLTEEQQAEILTSKASVRTNLHRAKLEKQRLYLEHLNRKREQRKEYFVQEAAFSGRTVEQEQHRKAMKDESHNLFSYTEYIYGKKRNTKLTSIEVPFRDKQGNYTNDPDIAVEWKRVSDPDEMGQLLISRNIKHFGQAKDTPFAQSVYESTFGYTGTKPEAATLFEQQMIPNSLQQLFDEDDEMAYVQLILQELTNGNHLPDINDDISYQSFWKGMRSWRPDTQTSPSGRHLGHYQSLDMPDGNDAMYDETNPNPSHAIKRVYFHIALATTLSGNTLQRWCNSSTMMIEKTPGQPKINKLRVIHIFEADYNLMLKLLWSRRLVWHAHQNQALHDAQAGSRPDYRCIDVVIRKTMNYLYSHLTRTALITIDNDAKACYDRIIVNLAMLISRYFGMTDAGCNFQGKTLRDMKYKVRTAAGETDTWYQHSNEQPLFGTGQGSCASPSIWLMVSSILMRCLDKRAHGMTQLDVLTTDEKREAKRICAEGFVDDVALFSNASTIQPISTDQLIQQANDDLHHWHQLLHSSGGKLELSKCFYYILQWSFNSMGDPEPMTKEEVEQENNRSVIAIKDPASKQSIAISHKDIDDAHRTLGAYKSMTGNEEEQIVVLKAKSDNLATLTKLGQLSRFQARRAYTAIYMPSMQYSLVTTNISDDDGKKIQSKALEAFLPAMGFERSFPRAVVFGSREHGGLNLGNLYVEGCIDKVSAILQHLRARTNLGRLMEINLNWLQLVAGISQPILEDVEPIPYVSENWFTHLRGFLRTVKGKIVLPQQWLPKPERYGDHALMDRFRSLKDVEPRERRIANNWRIYFKAFWLSDITTADGTKIQDCYWRRNSRERASRTTQIRWPIQDRPHSDNFYIWRKLLRRAFHVSNDGSLPIPLGKWIVTPQQSINRWHQYVDPYNRILYNYIEGVGYELHQCSGRSRSANHLKFSLDIDDWVIDLPERLVPVVVETTTLHFIVNSPPLISPVPRLISNVFREFKDRVEALPMWRRNLLRFWSSQQDVQEFRTIFQQASVLYLATDGSHNPEEGTGSYGAILANSGQIMTRCVGSAPGKPNLHTSFRAELYGLMAGCALLVELTKHYCGCSRQATELKIYLDSRSSIDRINRDMHQQLSLKTTIAPDFDIEAQILEELRILRHMGYKFSKLMHVKAHQDRYVKPWDLTWEAKLNIEADRVATSFNERDHCKQPYLIPTETRAVLFLSDEAITSRHQECLRTDYHSQDLRAFMQTKWKWKDDVVEDIWWSCHGLALKRFSHADRQRLQKFNFNRLPTNRRRRKFCESISSKCHDCCEEDETDDHVIQCQCALRTEARHIWLNEIEEYLIEQSTPTMMHEAIILGLQKQLHIPLATAIMTEKWPDSIRRAFDLQTKIGWDHFIKGRLSNHWKIILKEYRQTSQDKSGYNTTTNDWAVGLIVKIWKGVLLQWDLRNKSLHGHDDKTRHRAQFERLLQEARLLRNRYSEGHYYDRHWLEKTNDELQAYSVVALKAWVRNARTIVRLHDIERKSMDGQGDLSLYFKQANSGDTTGNNGGSRSIVDPC